MRNILVTGGAGYIGSHTVVELISSGYNPVIVDDYRNSEPSVLDGIETITGIRPAHINIDVTQKEDLRVVFSKFKFECIIHFAANKAVGESVDKPLSYYYNNVVSLISCLELAEEFGVKNFVFSSSCTVYGEPKDSKIVTEETPTQKANSPYGATKQMCERIISDLHVSGSEMRFLNLRYFNPVGAHSSSLIGELPIGRPSNLIPFVTQTAAGIQDELTVFGNDYQTKDGSCVRDFIHVVDLALAHIKGFEWLDRQDDAMLEIINVGTGKGTSVLEIIHVFEEVSGVSLNWKFGPRRAGDVEQIFADTSRAKNVLGWVAEKTIDDAIRDAWNWQKKLGNE